LHNNVIKVPDKKTPHRKTERILNLEKQLHETKDLVLRRVGENIYFNLGKPIQKQNRVIKVFDIC